jgi:glycosyltransferase involved in cell wall biosynthesis
MPAGQRRILYIHHGSGTGGAPLSLGYLIRELDRDRYEPLVSCHPDEDTAIDLFRRFGHEPATWRMVRFQHSEAGWWRPWAWRDWVPLVRWLRGYRASCAALRELLARLTPDVVHLNSITLLPYAKTIRACGPRVVGHIREPAAAGTLGLRRAWLRRRVRRYVDALVFICADNRDRLLGEGATRRQVNHRVIYNFVDFAEFDRGLDRSAARKQLGVADDVPVILFSGGSSSGIKGVLPLVRAIAKVRAHLPERGLPHAGNPIRGAATSRARPPFAAREIDEPAHRRSGRRARPDRRAAPLGFHPGHAYLLRRVRRRGCALHQAAFRAGGHRSRGDG